MAKVKKTSQKERGTYKYFDVNGKVVHELKTGEYGVSEIDIYELHQSDDSEIYYTMKNFQGIRTNKEKATIRAWIPVFIEQFTLEHHGVAPTTDVVQDAVKKEFPMVETFSLNVMDADYAEDKNSLHYRAYLEKESMNAFDPRIDCLANLLSKLTDDQQWLVQKVFYESVSQTEVAAELGITKQAVQNRLNKIYSRMRNLFEQ